MRIPLAEGWAALKHTVLSHSCVGIFSTPLPGIPRFNPQFFGKLFEDEYRTQLGIADGNLVAQLMGKPPQPMVLFGPARFQVLHTTIPGAAKLLGALMHEAHRLTNQQVPLISVIGFNSEHEWIKPAFKPSTHWLAEQYVAKGLKMAGAGTTAEALHVQFRLLLKAPDRNYNITLLPRGDAEDGIFAAINDHRDWNKAAPSSEETERLLKESVADINVRLTPMILGGVADD